MRRSLPLLLISLAVLAAYADCLRGPFIFDDPTSIVGNDSIQHWWPPWTPLVPPNEGGVTVMGRPILNLSLAINYALGGAAPWGYRLGNLLIHIAAALALYGLVRLTLKRRNHPHAEGVALAVMALWALHPLQTEAVSYVVQRAESMMGWFYLLTLYCFVRGWLGRSVLFCLLGMGTKEVMVSAPVIVFLYDRTFVAGSFAAAWRARRAYYLALAATWVPLALLVLGTGANRAGSVGWNVGVTPWAYGLTQFKAILTYFKLTFWPHPLVFEYGEFWARTAGDIVPGALLVAALLYLALRGLRRNEPVGFLGAGFFCILAPTSLVPGTTQMIVEHRMYLALAAVITGLVLWVDARLKRGQLLLAGAAALALASVTAARNGDYRSAVVLWTDTVRLRPDNPLAHLMLADALEKNGDDAGAVSHYEEALRLKPIFSVAQANFAAVELKLGRVGEAIAHFEIAARLQPKISLIQDGLGNAYSKAGRHEDALRTFRVLEQLSPKFAEGHYAAANELADLNRDGEAVPEYETALQLNSDYPEAHYNLANSLSALNRIPEAAAHYAAALRLRPSYPAAEYNWANALAMHGDPAAALAHYDAALRLNPSNADAESNDGTACLQLGRVADAIAHYHRALALRPNDPSIRQALATAEAKARGAPL